MRPDARLYLHTNDRRSCFEGHYKVFWTPGLPSVLGRAYLAARGRPTAYLATLRPLSQRRCIRLLEHAGGRLLQQFDLGLGRPVGRAVAAGARVLPPARRHALHRVHRHPPGGPAEMTLRDKLHWRRSQALAKVGLSRGWFRELSDYYRGKPRDAAG
jgi:hypothetical protein